METFSREKVRAKFYRAQLGKRPTNLNGRDFFSRDGRFIVVTLRSRHLDDFFGIVLGTYKAVAFIVKSQRGRDDAEEGAGQDIPPVMPAVRDSRDRSRGRVRYEAELNPRLHQGRHGLVVMKALLHIDDGECGRVTRQLGVTRREASHRVIDGPRDAISRIVSRGAQVGGEADEAVVGLAIDFFPIGLTCVEEVRPRLGHQRLEQLVEEKTETAVDEVVTEGARSSLKR